ncbi:MAG: winged helix-turn-helix domain-containing protein [Armatimonadetes bacterium]|nr:winged helix-turn-helix domain-containing protein [Armatimonadota bacterium]
MWRIELLGEPRVVGYGQTIVRFESKRAVALLAYLTLHPQTRHPREVLVDRIWPEADLDAGRNRLKQALSSLRRQLEPPWLGPGVVIDADRSHIGLRAGSFECDVAEFKEALVRGDTATARAMYRGELMPGYYDEWLEDARFELTSLALDLEDGPRPEPLSEPRPVAKWRRELPAEVTTFVGREDETRQVLDGLDRGRWVTVTGFGGIGKTRLTLQAARQWSEGDAVFVPLADAVEPGQVLSGIVRTLGGDNPQADVAAVAAFVGDRPTLVVLDNMEGAASTSTADALNRLLEQTPGLRLLVSSRVALKGRGESEVRLGPLPLPGPSDDTGAFATNPSVRLFVDRARNSRPDFQVTPRNAETVSEVCRRLDGIPLAIELCAAWSHLGVRSMLERLGTASSPLRARSTRPEERHNSLEKVFETTCDLLSPAARRLLGQLSVFRGGWDWELLEPVCEGSADFETLSELIEVSVVVPEYESDPPRFDMLVSVRQYAERLLEDTETGATNDRFVRHFTTLASMSRSVAPVPARDIVDQTGWIGFLSDEWPNVQHAAQVAASAGDPVSARTIVEDTEWFWSLYRSDGQILGCLDGDEGLTARILRATHGVADRNEGDVAALWDILVDEASRLGDDRILAEAALRKAKFKVLRQNMVGVEETAMMAKSKFEEAGDPVGLGQALHVLANCAIQKGDDEIAARTLDEADRHFRSAGSLVNLAAVAYTRCRALYMKERYAEALPALYACRDVAKGLRNMRFMGRTANLFGVVLRHLGQEDLARVYLYLAFESSREVRDVRAAHIPLWNLFQSLGTEGRWEDAVPVMGASMKAWETHYRSRLDPHDQPLLDRFLESAGSALGPTKMAGLEATGRALTLDECGDYLARILSGELAANEPETRSFWPSGPSRRDRS